MLCAEREEQGKMIFFLKQQNPFIVKQQNDFFFKTANTTKMILVYLGALFYF